MLKVFLVEDEIVVREGIKNKIDWKKYGFEFVGEASDGELAYPLLLKTRPDILITDIKMPFMDGLELSRLIKKEIPWIKIIIISGYDDFSYAKEGIKIGVTDYLLKPITSTKIIETLSKVRELIEREQSQKELILRYEKDTKEEKRLAEKDFFNQLVSAKTSVPQLLAAAEGVGISLMAGEYTILLFETALIDDVGSRYSELVVKLEEKIYDTYKNHKNAVLFNRDLEEYALLIKADSPDSSKRLIESEIETITRLFSEEESGYYIGVGETVSRISQLDRGFRTASRAFAYRFISSQDSVVYFDDLGPATAADTGESVKFKDINTAVFDRRVVGKFLKSGRVENTRYFVEEYFKSIGEEHLSSLILRQYITMNIRITSLSFLEALRIDAPEFLSKYGDLDQVLEVVTSLDQTKEHLIELLERVLALRDNKSNSSYTAWINEAREFILENYSNHDMSLNVVAQAVNISPTHFSAIFSQEVGQTFIEFLTSVRMEKAKELLTLTAKRSLEISDEVGYKDPHYFSYLFKKRNGQSPSEYRSGGGE